MRLLIVTEHFWPEDFRITDLAVAMAARGHDVEVLTAMPNYPGGRYLPGYRPWGPFHQDYRGVRLARVPVVPRGRGGPLRLVLNYSSFVVAAGLRLLLWRRRWDAVLVFQSTPVTTILPALLARSRSTPVVAWVQDLWPDTLASTGLLRSAWLLQPAGALSRWLYRRCDRLLGQSPAYLPRFEGMGVPATRCGVLPNWAEDLFERPRLPAPETSPPWGETFSVMFAGNLGRVQALDTVLDAVAKVRLRARCAWAFIGDGVLRSWLEEEVRRRALTDCVYLMGRRPVEEMPSWYARASAMLVSLKAEPILSMTIPSKLQSYLAAGRPVLGSLDGEGARIVRESGAGFVAPAGDADGLADAVVRMAGLERGERLAMGARGQDYYRRNFSRERCLERLEAELTLAASAAGGDKR